ncbi:EmrB/QacA subfamily drug resistance transporter [Mycobacterium frederiksbergense]|uniref:EmrB/QacA subfamily drug resistance transporter n=1 Tax=Mycolicibacterium frederiksbergense TaxID=117567 RepID=A0ABT6KUH8_9MYCO|nr:MDR family MFS transporter [Mycolicibacterium frederiksbergense]MDH6194253.1 EmrB/QacA subfamily drug resistance transporter [Mycolicibacterium frederiksbergense]
MTNPTTDQQPREALLSPRRRNLVFLAVLLGMLLASLNQTIVATALPTVVADLGGAGRQSWVVTSYLLASTIVTAVVGKIGDIFGRKAVYQTAVVCFLAGSVLSGLSGSMATLVASRALQGIGGGAIMVTSTALIAEVIPLRDRGRYQGALGAVFGVTTVAGPLLGGFVTEHLGWRWAFWLSIPVGVVVLLVAAATIPAVTARTARPVIDYAGIFWVALGASGLTLATSLGGELAWTSPIIIGLVVGSILALVMFVRAETRAAEPILPMRLFRNPVFSMCCVLSLVVGFAMLGALTFMPTFMQFVEGVSPSESGLRTMPMVIGLLITSTISGSLVGRTGRYKIYPVAGTLIMLIGFVLLSRMNAATPIPLQSLYLFILGAGIGMCMQVLVLIVQNTSEFTDLGVATSGVTFFRTIGSSFGAAIFGSLFAGFLSDRLPGALAASGAPSAAGDSPKVLHELSPEAAAPIVNAYADALDLVFLCAAPVALLGFVVALFLKEVPLREAEATLAADLGEGFGMPIAESPEQVLETVVSRLMRSSPEIRLRTVAGGPGCELDVAGLWALLKIYRHGQVFGSARLTEIADRLGVPFEVLEPTFNRLVQDGYVLRTGDNLWLTQTGLRQVDGVSAALVGRIVDKLAASPSFEGRPDRAQVEAALERIAHKVVQRDWDDDRAELTGART